MKHLRALTLVFVFTFVCAAHAADPLTVHKAGFGPTIDKLQLGKPLTLLEMLNAQFNIGNTVVPPMFSLLMADNPKAVDQEDSSPKQDGKWLLMNFTGPSHAMIMNGGGGMLALVPDGGTFEDLFKVMKENGLNYASTPNITICDERIIQFSMQKEHLPVKAATTEEFAQWLSTTYSLGTMEQKGDNYEAQNAAEGWRAVVTESVVTFYSAPAADKAGQ